MTQSTSGAHPVATGRASIDAVTADEQETLRLDGSGRAADRANDPDATRPMSLADLLNSD
ncbi:hypothetical protein GCM10010399_46290 [Dactylosporangium fulvum]|uniref:Uncharacterized protein n=1 Tax=Dactylosporangium fulvum TaxID=53359 RepID=A0ABY5W4C9_9ACTN|nr:hypothetical protein [Dactylosporangium fulvum]UWP83578.1 hypothetical protein Dfulv_04660 [Dactylosporangium fulvum]